MQNILPTSICVSKAELCLFH